MSKLPIQPIYTDDRGTTRFRENKIVRYLLDNGGLDLNKLAWMLPDCNEDWEQFAQLIGYSVSGFGSLSYVSDETYKSAQAIANDPKLSEQEARLDHLESIIAGLRQDVKAMVPRLFKIHPDDLQA